VPWTLSAKGVPRFLRTAHPRRLRRPAATRAILKQLRRKESAHAHIETPATPGRLGTGRSPEHPCDAQCHSCDLSGRDGRWQRLEGASGSTPAPSEPRCRGLEWRCRTARGGSAKEMGPRTHGEIQIPQVHCPLSALGGSVGFAPRWGQSTGHG
jgi:hypothetical protein